MPRKLSILYLRRTHVDAEHVRYLATLVLTLAAGCAFVIRLSQASNQIFAQFAYGLGVNAVVDGLV
jgi:hypothetical protein